MNSVELYTEKSCCGCGVCAVTCPQNAIWLTENKYGFIYPQIDENKCINCGACKKVCVYSKEKIKNEYESFACVNTNVDLLMKSASGGVFSAIAFSFLKSGGYVCGAAAEIKNGIITVEHRVINKVDELYQLQGSKYVQSCTLISFEKIQQLLKKGEKVFFSGTPCQVDAIKSLCKQYIGKTLFTIDVICHGVPSQKLLNGYLQCIQKKKGACLTYVDFRNKQYGWGLTGIAKFKGKNDETITPDNSSYYKLFLEGEIYRNNCYSCPYASMNRVGDLTIGDYWGFQDLSPELKFNPMISEKRGVSCLIVNNQIGHELLYNYGGELVTYPVEIEKVMVINTQLREPVKHTAKREYIMNTFVNKGYEPIEKLFQREMAIKRYKIIIKNIIPKPIKIIIGKM